MKATSGANLNIYGIGSYGARSGKAPSGKAAFDAVDFFRTILSRLPFSVVVADCQDRVIFTNDNARRIWGNSLSAGSGESLKQFFAPNISIFLDDIHEKLNNGDSWQGEILLNRDGHASAIIEMCAFKLDEDAGVGKPHVNVFICHDITVRRQDERRARIREKTSTRSEMAAEISHELNNYLSIVFGNLELLNMEIDKGKTDNLRPRLKSMMDGVTRIAKFVESLADVAGPEPMSESIDLRSLLESEILFLKSQPRFGGIEFIGKWEKNVPPIEADRGRLQQALYSIFCNSLDALADISGPKRITVAVTYQAETVKLAISDNGRGMSEDDYKRVFRQFFTTKGTGHGFGLLAVKGAIKSHGGRVSATPGPDGGACFIIEFPTRTAAPKPVTSPVAV
jgi:signal transduction histidine kinase